MFLCETLMGMPKLHVLLLVRFFILADDVQGRFAGDGGCRGDIWTLKTHYIQSTYVVLRSLAGLV